MTRGSARNECNTPEHVIARGHDERSTVGGREEPG